jgi:N-acetylglucosamine kinase-like BadF-type ATPase
MNRDFNRDPTGRLVPSDRGDSGEVREKCQEKNRESQGEPLFLGIDGGGTKTIAWLGRLSGTRVECVGTGLAGPSNLQVVGHPVAFQNIRQAIEAAMKQAGFPESPAINPLIGTPLASACLCLAGAGRPADQKIVLDWAGQSGLFHQFRLIGEAEAVLAAVNQPCPVECADIVLLGGTGSLAWGLSPGGQKSARCGGWGYLLGDEGSGFWLGQQLLQLACREADGRQAGGGILEQVLKELQLSAAEQLVNWTYQQAGARERIAGLAKLFFTDPGPRDRFKDSSADPENPSLNPILQPILQLAASEMARLVGSVARQLGEYPDYPYRLTMAGSVLCQQPVYQRLVEQQLRKSLLPPVELQRVEHPVAGALKLASQMVSR